MTSIAQINENEQREIRGSLKKYFAEYHLSGLLKMCRAEKQKGFSAFEIFRYLLCLVFCDRSMYMQIVTGRYEERFSKNAVYRFLSSARTNWERLICTLSERIINSSIRKLIVLEPEGVIRNLECRISVTAADALSRLTSALSRYPPLAVDRASPVVIHGIQEKHLVPGDISVLHLPDVLDQGTVPGIIRKMNIHSQTLPAGSGIGLAVSILPAVDHNLCAVRINKGQLSAGILRDAGQLLTGPAFKSDLVGDHLQGGPPEFGQIRLGFVSLVQRHTDRIRNRHQ